LAALEALPDETVIEGEIIAYDTDGFCNGFGSTLFRYTRELGPPAYDPITGQNKVTVPARQHMYSYLTRWMRDLRIDGIRLDSVENLAN